MTQRPTRKRSNLPRRIRFFVLEKILLPIAVVPLRIIVRSWRRDPPEDSIVRAISARPRVIFLTCHGMFLQLLAYRYLAPSINRRLVVMLTPSLDGRLLAATLSHFGIDHVMAAPGNRSVAGALEFRRRVEEGGIGVIAVDGPRGPAGIVQPRAFELARTANADFYLAIPSARRGIRFGSWDKAHLPLPFARTALRLEKFVPPAGSTDLAIATLQEAMVRLAVELESPVIAAALNRK